MLVHLQLREYRLREGRYPDSLEPLNLQELAIDPFSGQPFGYRLTGERYQLSSGKRHKLMDYPALKRRIFSQSNAPLESANSFSRSRVKRLTAFAHSC
jgi:hypothetical protein